MTELLAHSARRDRPAQTYEEHIRNVTAGALQRAQEMLCHYAPVGQRKPTSHELLAIVDEQPKRPQSYSA